MTESTPSATFEATVDGHGLATFRPESLTSENGALSQVRNLLNSSVTKNCGGTRLMKIMSMLRGQRFNPMKCADRADPHLIWDEDNLVISVFVEGSVAYFRASPISTNS